MAIHYKSPFNRSCSVDIVEEPFGFNSQWYNLEIDSYLASKNSVSSLKDSNFFEISQSKIHNNKESTEFDLNYS